MLGGPIHIAERHHSHQAVHPSINTVGSYTAHVEHCKVIISSVSLIAMFDEATSKNLQSHYEHKWFGKYTEHIFSIQLSAIDTCEALSSEGIPGC